MRISKKGNFIRRINYKVILPFEIIVRGNKFLEAHPGVEIEDYLRAQVVLFSTSKSDFLKDDDIEEEDFSEEEMLFSFNLSFEKSLKSILEERGISVGHYIRDACIQIHRGLILGKEDTIRNLSLILKSM